MNIPDISYLFLAGPPWLLLLLATVTFWIHLLLVGTALGGSIFLVLRHLAGRNRAEVDRRLNTRLIKTLPVVISLSITFGVAPLLFIQVLYPQFFFPANIFLAPWWLGSLGLLVVGFSCVYFAFRCRERGWVIPVLALTPLCFLGILYIFTNNAVLAIAPQYWPLFQRGLARLHVPDAMTLPRLLHNFGATFVLSGLAIVLIGRWRDPARPSEPAPAPANAAEVSPPPSPALAQVATRAGLIWMLLGLCLQIPLGLWFVLSLPREPLDVMGGLVGLRNWNSFFWWVAVLLALVNFLAVIKTLKGGASAWWLRVALAAPPAGLIGMLLARQYLRGAFLSRPVAGSFYHDQWALSPQWGAFTIFLLSFLCALALVGLMVYLVIRSKKNDRITG